MKMTRNILFILLVVCSVVKNDILAQDLSKLSEHDRNLKLIEIAKEVYKAPRIHNFYREFGTPVITEMKTRILPAEERKKISENDDIWHGSSNDQKFYIVYFKYDMNKELFEQGYAAKVYIWENTGKAFAIGLGNMFMLPVRNGKIPDHDKPAPYVEYYKLTYSKDVPNAASLPQYGKRGDLVTIELKTAKSVAYDGWTTETGYNFDPDKDLINGEIISDKYKAINKNVKSRVVQIMVTGEMKVNVEKYEEEYEDAY